MSSRCSGQSPRLARCLLLGFVLVSCILFSGIIYGWAPLVILLKEDGFYAALCPVEVNSCAQQDDKLNFAYTMATTTMALVGLPTGVILDRFGAPTTTAIAAIIEVVGLALIATVNNEGDLTLGNSGLVVREAFVIGVVAIGVGGSLYMFAAFHVTLVWTQHQAIIMACINCLFDGSTVVFAVMYYLHQTFHLSRGELFSGFAIFAASFSVLLIVFWGLNTPPKDSSHTDYIADDDEGVLLRDVDEPQEETTRETPIPSIDDNAKPSQNKKCLNIEDSSQPSATNSFWGQVKSLNFVFILLYCSSHIVRSNFFLGTANLMLDHLGDSAAGNYYTKVTGYIIPCGFAVIPFIGFAVDKLGIVGSCQLVNVLGVMYNAGSLIPSLPTQLYTAAVYTTYRAFVFSVITTYNAQVFGMQVLGRIQGLLFLVAALLNLSMNPIVTYTNAHLDGDFFWPTIFQMVMLAPLMVLTEIVRRNFSQPWKSASISLVEDSAL